MFKLSVKGVGTLQIIHADNIRINKEIKNGKVENESFRTIN